MDDGAAEGRGAAAEGAMNGAIGAWSGMLLSAAPFEKISAPGCPAAGTVSARAPFRYRYSAACDGLIACAEGAPGMAALAALADEK